MDESPPSLELHSNPNHNDDDNDSNNLPGGAAPHHLTDQLNPTLVESPQESQFPEQGDDKGWLSFLNEKAKAVITGPHSKPALPSARTASEFQHSISNFVYNDATPGEQALMHRARGLIQSLGLASVQTLLDSVFMPGEGEMMLECGKENAVCTVTKGCGDKNGKVTVIYGANPSDPKNYKKKEFPEDVGKIKCSTRQFGGGDPAFGQVKNCWVQCAKGDGTPVKVKQCSTGVAALAGRTEWANIPLCIPPEPKYSLSIEERTLQGAFKSFCESDSRKDLMRVSLNCNYQEAFATFTSQQPGSKVPASDGDSPKWIGKAWVTFFKGTAKGLSHSMMVSNLIRSVHLFSKHPVIVYVVGTHELSVDWDPKVFPRLIVMHADGISTSYKGRGGDYVSFNFEKFRSMMLRVKVGVQLDADMINGPNCDKLFEATAKEVTAEYPYPIMPVHWMSRYRGKKGEKIDGYEVYAISYPGDEGDSHFPPRIRWAHAHPTWSYHALPFIADALLSRLNYSAWADLPRVIEAIGSRPRPNPSIYNREDEDLLNILLWRYKAHKQWCKWDLEPSIYQDFVNGASRLETMKDTRWYPDGVPLVLLSMHNTKNTIETDKLLHTILKRGINGEKYLYWKGRYFDSPASFKKEFGDKFNAPCVLV